MINNPFAASPLEDWSEKFDIGTNLQIKRDDLLPFPLAGNKFRKVLHEFHAIGREVSTVSTVGAITSNHARTTAMFAAQQDLQCHLLLHGDFNRRSSMVTLSLLSSLGATYEVIDPSAIATRVAELEDHLGNSLHFIYGGCHTRLGVEAYRSAIVELSKQISKPPDLIIHASGTGATQAGLILGIDDLGWETSVTGVSIARDERRAVDAVRECLRWFDREQLEVEVDASFLAGGYGESDSQIDAAVKAGWSVGLPLDGTYTGKAFAALLGYASQSQLPKSVLFWHTGGLFTHLAAKIDGSN